MGWDFTRVYEESNFNLGPNDKNFIRSNQHVYIYKVKKVFNMFVTPGRITRVLLKIWLLYSPLIVETYLHFKYTDINPPLWINKIIRGWLYRKRHLPSFRVINSNVRGLSCEPKHGSKSCLMLDISELNVYLFYIHYYRG